MDIYEELSSIVADYINENSELCDQTDDAEEMYMFDINNLLLTMNCSNIILNERDFKFNPKNNVKYSLKQCDDLVEEFFGQLNPSYLDYYRLRKSDGTVDFDFLCQQDQPYSGYDDSDNITIYIPITSTIEDAFSIVHEVFHNYNLGNKESLTDGYLFTTECLSYLCEFLFSDFLLSKGFNESNDIILRDLYSLRRLALEFNFSLSLILKYLNNGYIDKYIVSDIISSYPDEYYDYLCYFIYDICDKGELNLDNAETYILSGLLSTYMYDRIRSNKKNLNELFDLNDVLNDYSLSQVLDYLDLDYTDCELTLNSYSVLRKSYKKFIKR